jgi:hypothetical protein
MSEGKPMLPPKRAVLYEGLEKVRKEPLPVLPGDPRPAAWRRTGR